MMNDPSIRIKLKNVTKRFGIGDAEISALDNVDLTVKKGEFIAIMGPSGWFFDAAPARPDSL